MVSNKKYSVFLAGLCALAFMLLAHTGYGTGIAGTGDLSGYTVKLKNTTTIDVSFEARIDNQQEVSIGEPRFITGTIAAGGEVDANFSGNLVSVARNGNLPVHCHFFVTGPGIPPRTTITFNPATFPEFTFTPENLKLVESPLAGTGEQVITAPAVPGTVTITVTNNTGKTLTFDATLFLPNPVTNLAPVVRGSFPTGKSVVEFQCPDKNLVSAEAKYSVNVISPDGKKGAFKLNLFRDGKLLSISATQLQ